MFKSFAKAALLTATLFGAQNLVAVEPVVAFGWRSQERADKPAFDKSGMIGNWRGQVKTATGHQIPLRLLIRPAGGNSLALTMIYGGERGCLLDGTLENESNGSCRFSLKSHGGGFCNTLSQLTLTMKSANSIAYTVSGAHGKALESGMVRK